MMNKAICLKITFFFIYFLFLLNNNLLARVNVDLVYDLNLKEMYDSNLYLTEKDEESDWATIINPSIALEATAKKWKGSLSYSLAQYLYSDHNEDNYLEHNINFSMLYKVSKNLDLNMYSGYLMTQDLYTVDVPVEQSWQYTNQDYTIRKKRRYHSNYSGGARVNYQFGERNQFYVGYNHYRNWEDDKSVNEATRYNPFMGLDFELSKHLLLSFTSSYIKGDFYGAEDFDEINTKINLTQDITKHFSVNVAYSHTYMDHSGNGEDYQIYFPSAGIDYNFSKNSSFRLNIGYYHQDKDKGEDESGININADLRKSWSLKKGKLSFSYISGFEETYFGAENLGFTIYQAGNLYFLYEFTRHLSNFAFISYRFNKYTEEDPDRKDHIIAFGDNLIYKVKKWLNVSVSYNYRQLNSNIDKNDYEDHRIFVSLIFYNRTKLLR